MYLEQSVTFCSKLLNYRDDASDVHRLQSAAALLACPKMT